MRTDVELPTPQVPSMRTLARASAIALAVALLLLMTVVLPAEYGIDPLGTGRAMGLVALTEAPADEPAAAPPAGAALVPAVEGAVGYYPAEYKFDAREIVLQPYDFIEYKYRLEKGATMLFSWSASSDVVHDFHGEPDGAAKDYSESFDKRSRRRGDGSFTAPFSGIHGWFWENQGNEPVTVKLVTAGFYSSAVEIQSNRARAPRELRSLETLAAGEN